MTEPARWVHADPAAPRPLTKIADGTHRMPDNRVWQRVCDRGPQHIGLILGRYMRWQHRSGFAFCMAAFGWVLLDAHADSFGLPVGILGQILGDPLLMGLTRPLITDKSCRGQQPGVPGRTVLKALTLATHRIQVFDFHLCLAVFGLPANPDVRTLGERRVLRSDLLAALKTVMSNDVCVEILLPDPEHYGGSSASGSNPEFLRSAVQSFAGDLTTLADTVVYGKLDVHLHAAVTTLSMIRCDERDWFYVHPKGVPRAAMYLPIDARSDNARALYD